MKTSTLLPLLGYITTLKISVSKEQKNFRVKQFKEEPQTKASKKKV